MAAGIVGDDLVRDAFLHEFPTRVMRALIARPGFIDPDKNLPAFPVRQINWGRCAAPVHQRQPAGIAMRQHPVIILDQRQPGASDRLHPRDVFIGNLFRDGDRFRRCPCVGANPVERVLEIGSSRARVQQCPVRLVEIDTFEISLRHSVAGRSADGAGPADDHRGDGFGGLPVILEAEQGELVRQ